MKFPTNTSWGETFPWQGGLAIPFIGIDSVINVKPEAGAAEGGSTELPIAEILPLSTFHRPLLPKNRTISVSNDKETRRRSL